MTSHKTQALPGGCGKRFPLEQDKAIALGHPSYVWGFGQERRLSIIRRHLALENRSILDVGCGLGMYVRAFHRFSQQVYGVDVDPAKVAAASRAQPNLCVALAENLPYPREQFDVVLSHEVIEHVTDDRQAIADAVRVLCSPGQADAERGGRLVVFAPNRLYPFETHGVYWRGKYRFGNVPLVNYLPDRWRDRLCPHVRTYTKGDLRRLLAGLPVRVLVHTQIFAGYDKIAARSPLLGRMLRGLTYLMERTPLRILGLSHLLIVEKTT
jgi:SAM-dependent methyltransferase